VDHSSERETLKRISKESGEHIRAGHASCADSAQHVKQSRAAVDRSLDLLRETAKK
jgi:hypothetical protein